VSRKPSSKPGVDDREAPASGDRRIKRSRDLLLSALFSLMSERGYERLTIQNIIDRASVGRATFYAHFDSKNALLASSVSGLREFVLSTASKNADVAFPFTLPFFEHLATARSIFELTVARANEVTVERHIRAMLSDLVRQDLQRQRPQLPSPALELGTLFVVGVLWSTIVWWMSRTPAESPAEIDRIFRQLTLPGLAATLETRQPISSQQASPSH
jgi:AcrR family transcriptional regulator